MAIKTAIVTGGGRGIGLAITNKLRQHNYHVYIVDLSFDNPEEDLKNNTKDFTFIKCDITKSDEINEVFKTLKLNHQQLDLLVNNAGIIRDNMIWKMPEEDFDNVIQVNLKGTWLMCKEASKIMKEQKFGRMVNIASRAWLGNRGQTNYAASKAGVISLTRVLALELGKYNIFVNAVAPGLIDTALSRGLEPNVLQSLIEAQPSKTIGKPEDVAKAVYFLGSNESDFITGQVLYVDGGKSIGSNFI
ncbi:MAG: SDR family oxidoreductase [Sphingobacteriaceae bacterium]|nr:SDR family oxidoreductase [Sphingobacteriaceae bacterium]